MLIEVVYAEQNDQRHIELDVEEGADVTTCLGLLLQHPMGLDLPFDDFSVGIFGEVCAPEQLLKDGDRLELYRPLIADAKTARRLRAKSQTF